MILVRSIPLYWGIETDAVDHSFLTRATLQEVSPPFRQSIRAFRIRLSRRRWLHVGTYRYDAMAGRWGLDRVDPNEIGAWGRKKIDDDVEAALAGAFGADPDSVETRPVLAAGPDRPARGPDDADRGTVPGAQPYRA